MAFYGSCFINTDWDVAVMWWKVITTILISLCCWMQASLADTVAVKPTTPIQVSILPESGVVAGGRASFVVRVSSTYSSNQLKIQVALPEGAELMSGALQWSGGISQDETRELRFELRLPRDTVPDINVIATIQSSNGGQLAATDVYHQPLATPTAFKVAPGRTVSRQGRSVVEYSLK